MTLTHDAHVAFLRGDLEIVAYTRDDDTFGGPFRMAHVAGCKSLAGFARHGRSYLTFLPSDADTWRVVPCPRCILGLNEPVARPNYEREIAERETPPAHDHGRPSDRPSRTPDDYLAEFLTFCTGLDRKAEVRDMTDTLVRGAGVYVRRYEDNADDFCRDFLLDLKARGRNLTAGQAKGVANCARAMLRNQRQARPAQAAPLPDVPEGRYAVTPDHGSETAFYKVDRPTEGRWAGYTFVKQIIGGREPQRVPRDAVARILEQIVTAGVQEAMLRYGREIGHCGHCGRTLTNDESRERGIGPICAAKVSAWFE